MTTPTHEESMKIIMEKVDVLAAEMVKSLEEQLRSQGITDDDMLAALKFSISQKMLEKSALPEHLKQ